jgi:hypothetical protein
MEPDTFWTYANIAIFVAGIIGWSVHWFWEKYLRSKVQQYFKDRMERQKHSEVVVQKHKEG